MNALHIALSLTLSLSILFVGGSVYECPPSDPCLACSSPDYLCVTVPAGEEIALLKFRRLKLQPRKSRPDVFWRSTAHIFGSLTIENVYSFCTSTKYMKGIWPGVSHGWKRRIYPTRLRWTLLSYLFISIVPPISVDGNLSSRFVA